MPCIVASPRQERGGGAGQGEPEVSLEGDIRGNLGELCCSLRHTCPLSPAGWYVRPVSEPLGYKRNRPPALSWSLQVYPVSPSQHRHLLNGQMSVYVGREREDLSPLQESHLSSPLLRDMLWVCTDIYM